MKKLVFVTLAVISFNIAAYAQGQGMTLVGGSYGISPGNNGSTQMIALEYSNFLRKNWLLNLTGLYEFGSIQTTKVNNYLFSGGIDYSTFQVGNLVFFDAGISVLVGGETLKSSINFEKKNSFVAGLSGNVNIKIHLFEGIALVFKAEQNYLPASMLGKWYPSFYIGIKYLIF